MKPGSSRTKIAFLALGLGLAMALAAGHGETRGADGPALVIGEDGCRFSPQIQRVLASLPDYSDMQMHTDRRTARFAFEDLHGVGVAGSWDAEWSEVRLYFREDLPALKATLERMGLRVDGGGRVAVPTALQDDMALSVEAAANDGRHFPAARSYLACGSV